MDIIEIMCAIIIAACIIALIVCFIALRKANNTFRNEMIMTNAIYEYQKYCIANNLPMEVSYEDIKPDKEIFRNLFDWGYTNILPKEKFEIIKPYIE